MLPPGSPTTGLTLSVYDATTNAESGKVAQHMILIEPGPRTSRSARRFLCENQTQKTYSDPVKRIGAVLRSRGRAGQDAGDGYRSQRHADLAARRKDEKAGSL